MKGNLLIVEDETLLLEGLVYRLKHLSDQTFKAGNGLEALDVLEKHEIHCILCDINMPKLNGVEVIKRIRATGNNVPFIFYTGHGNRDLMLEVAKYGAFDFLDKPSFDGLEEVVGRGLKAGINVDAENEESNGGFISEYKKLLSQLG